MFLTDLAVGKGLLAGGAIGLAIIIVPVLIQAIEFLLFMLVYNNLKIKNKLLRVLVVGIIFLIISIALATVFQSGKPLTASDFIFELITTLIEVLVAAYLVNKFKGNLFVRSLKAAFVYIMIFILLLLIGGGAIIGAIASGV